MGQAILYCFRCSTQLREVQFEQGKAFRMDSRVCCSACFPEASKALPPNVVEELLKQQSGERPRATSSSTSSPVLRPITPRQAVPTVSASRARPLGRSNAWTAVGVVGAVGILLLIVLLSSRSSGDGASAPAPTPRKPIVKTPPPVSLPKLPPETPPSRTPDAPVREALAHARKFAREHPDDLFGQLREFEDLTLQGDPGEAGQEARKEVQSLRVRGKDAVDRSLARLDQEVSLPVERQEFGKAFDLLEAAKARLEWPEWKLSVDGRIRQMQTKMDALYEPLKTKAVEAKAKGDLPGVDSIVAQVRGWGSRRLTSDLADALDGVAGPPVRIPLADFEKDPKGWGFVGGQEFPGAKGSLKADTTVFHGGRRSYRLQGDFSGGGMYVGLWCDLQSLKERDVQEIRLWVKTTTIKSVGVRVVDNSDQCHQKNGGIALGPTTDWQELVLRVPDMVGGEHWGGANDGRWHGPAKGFGLNIGKGTFRTAGETQGTLWVDDVDLVVRPSPGARHQ